ncbi:TonB C-terminal domain-containing protein [Mariprofundus erugo]|uniref:energy transducer TonB n=1 Tax=Mariprofundus erugo TaxID=2528639 RepID=UPI0010FE8A53|nr:energy transducer TonB [Mariprofundus erugo]TLS76237.1 TonB C-terminal domain-containing protein [Mariprofundus erugo]
MSPSRTARQPRISADLSKSDLLFALLLHAVVLAVIVVLAFWQQRHPDEPLKRIEVMMISSRQLADMEQQARKATKQVKQHKPTESRPPKPAPEKPKPAPRPKPQAKPVLKLEEKPKPATKPKPAEPPKQAEKVRSEKKKTVKADENFDPFAPVASSTDSKANTTTTRRTELADLAGKQLSSNEMERYIGMMQAAVQEHWKVPASAATTIDPLVEMELAADGSVVAVKIVESSGNELLDASLIRAIHAAAPFQLPAEQFEFFRVNHLRFHPIK